MMTRQEIRELAAFQADENKGAYALSFYFQPDPPQQIHRALRRRRDAIQLGVEAQVLECGQLLMQIGSVADDADVLARVLG